MARDFAEGGTVVNKVRRAYNGLEKLVPARLLCLCQLGPLQRHFKSWYDASPKQCDGGRIRHGRRPQGS